VILDLEQHGAVHNVQMLKQSNQRGSWFSHKTLEGWCKGK
jgi:hypothetical protein